MPDKTATSGIDALQLLQIIEFSLSYNYCAFNMLVHDQLISERIPSRSTPLIIRSPLTRSFVIRQKASLRAAKFIEDILTRFRQYLDDKTGRMR